MHAAIERWRREERARLARLEASLEELPGAEAPEVRFEQPGSEDVEDPETEPGSSSSALARIGGGSAAMDPVTSAHAVGTLLARGMTRTADRALVGACTLVPVGAIGAISLVRHGYLVEVGGGSVMGPVLGTLGFALINLLVFGAAVGWSYLRHDPSTLVNLRAAQREREHEQDRAERRASEREARLRARRREAEAERRRRALEAASERQPSSSSAPIGSVASGRRSTLRPPRVCGRSAPTATVSSSRTAPPTSGRARTAPRRRRSSAFRRSPCLMGSRRWPDRCAHGPRSSRASPSSPPVPRGPRRRPP